MAAWIAENVPANIPREERWLWPRQDYKAKQKRFAATLRELGRAALPRVTAQRLLIVAFEQADRYDAWRRARRPDPNREEQHRQRQLAQQTGRLAAAARLLAEHFRTVRGVSAAPLYLAELRVAKPTLVEDDATGEAFEALRYLWSGWQKEPGDAPGAPLARLLGALADEIQQYKGGGPAAFARGPWTFRTRVDGARARSVPSDATAAAFLVSALARGCSLDWPLHMDGSGAPRWALAAAFASDLTGSRISARSAREVVTRLVQREPGIRFGGWPTPAGDTSEARAP